MACRVTRQETARRYRARATLILEHHQNRPPVRLGDGVEYSDQPFLEDSIGLAQAATCATSDVELAEKAQSHKSLHTFSAARIINRSSPAGESRSYHSTQSPSDDAGPTGRRSRVHTIEARDKGGSP
jgi:hypothetical protein